MLNHWKGPWCWERLKAGEGDDRGWDGWMASPTWWTWVWVNSESWWWTGRPGVLQSMGCKVLDMNEQLKWTELIIIILCPRSYSSYIWKFVSLNHISSIPPHHLQLLVAPFYSVPISLAFLDSKNLDFYKISTYKGDHTIFVFLSLT